MYDEFERCLKKIEGISWFVTTCRGCGACFASRTIGKMSKWEAEHNNSCPAPVLAEY